MSSELLAVSGGLWASDERSTVSCWLCTVGELR